MADPLHHPTSLSALEKIFSNNTYVAIDFSAAWCGPCKTISPIFVQLAKKHGVEGTLAFAKIDVDEAKDVAQKYQISAMPTFMFFKEGKQVAVNGNTMIRGADVKSLTAASEKLGGLAQKKKAGAEMAHPCLPSNSLPLLPPELVELVANWLSPEDLLALYATCRETHHKLQRMVSDVHFSKKTVLLSSPDSMQMLRDLSKVYGARLKKINIHLAMIKCYFHVKYFHLTRGEEEMYLRLSWTAPEWAAALAEVLRNVDRAQSGVSLSLVHSLASQYSGKTPTTAIGSKKSIKCRHFGPAGGNPTHWSEFPERDRAALMHAIEDGGRQILRVGFEGVHYRRARMGQPHTCREGQPSADRKPTKLLEIRLLECPMAVIADIVRGLGVRPLLEDISNSSGR
ncbi:mitochondrial thioredoxin [Elasticomyces elasticus]|nr:mitochondrial thioredoxin [Elasticomyces elasticus]